MGDRKITLFELHFDGPLSLGPSFGSDDDGDQEATGGEASADAGGGFRGSSDAADEDLATDEGGMPVKGALLGLLAIAALAAAARVLLGGDDAEEPADDGPEMVSIDEAADKDA